MELCSIRWTENVVMGGRGHVMQASTIGEECDRKK